MTINVLVVDDQHLVRMGLCSLLTLSNDINVIAQLSDGCDVITTCKTLSVDIILLDIRMPITDGLTVLAQLAESNITTPALMLTTFDEHKLMLQCIQLGAKGYLCKDVNLSSLLTAINRVIQGEHWLRPSLLPYQSEQQDSSHNSVLYPNNIEPLTDKEIQILHLIAAGYANHEIAIALHNSAGTIRNAVSVILTKLHARDRTKAVMTALRLSLIT